MADPRIRQIKIKTGVLKRIAKEKIVYEREAEQQKNRIQKLKDEGVDEHNIRKQEEVLQESLMMVPDCQRRLVKAFSDLKSTLETEQDLKEQFDYVAAEQILKDTEVHMSDSFLSNKIMSHDQYNFNNDFTFQLNIMHHDFSVPPPSHNLGRNLHSVQISDEDYMKKWDQKIIPNISTKKNLIKISDAKQEFRNIITALNELKAKEKHLKDNMEILSEDKWKNNMTEVCICKALIDEKMKKIDGEYLMRLRSALAKRASKRIRLKRLAQEKNQLKAKRAQEWEERSQKIDENLQKLKDDVTKEEEKSKRQADVILQKVLRKKQDAKKYIATLDALVKLRRARQNTAKGRGQQVSETDAEVFNDSIETLKNMWLAKQSLYEKEESELRLKLKDNSDQLSTVNKIEAATTNNIKEWRSVMFGGPDLMPQFDFHGDIDRFITVRAQWDQFISYEGTPLPVGWLLPSFNTNL